MITIENLKYSPDGGPPYLLDGLDFHVAPGGYVSIIGDNGSGKTTLLRLILGLLKPAAGTVKVTASGIGLLPQRKDTFDHQFPITVYEVLDSYRRIKGIKDKSAALTALREVGLQDRCNAIFGTLSYGQSQKVLLARALIGEPELLILDEPSTGIDQRSQREIYATLRELNQQRGLTIVSVEHNLRAAVANSTTIFHLADGKGHFDDPSSYISEYMSAADV